MFRFRVAVIFVLTACAALPSAAQERASVKRADGRLTPLLVYAADAPAKKCPPLAVISHGAGGSENGYRYLAQAMAQNGFRTIVMGHRESGLAALRNDVREEGIKKGVSALVTDTNAETARLLDVGAALQWADALCKAPFRVLLGHSMGSETGDAGGWREEHDRRGIATGWTGPVRRVRRAFAGGSGCGLPGTRVERDSQADIDSHGDARPVAQGWAASKTGSVARTAG